MDRFSLALIAHDSKKEDMLQMVKKYRDEISRVDVVATKGTGLLIQGRTGLTVTLMSSGPHGGDQQIGALVTHGEVQVVVFLRDPLTAQAHEPDISALLRICDVHDVPLATNLATADVVLSSIFRQHYAKAEPALV